MSCDIVFLSVILVLKLDHSISLIRDSCENKIVFIFNYYCNQHCIQISSNSENEKRSVEFITQYEI